MSAVSRMFLAVAAAGALAGCNAEPTADAAPQMSASELQLAATVYARQVGEAWDRVKACEKADFKAEGCADLSGEIMAQSKPEIENASHEEGCPATMVEASFAAASIKTPAVDEDERQARAEAYKRLEICSRLAKALAP